MSDPRRISPSRARTLMSEEDALLVCAYDHAGKCEEKKLEGAISLDELQERESELSQERALIFYCA